MDNIYSIGTAAARLDCHPETVRRLIRRGELSAVKLGSQWRVRESDLQKYFDAHATTAKRDDQSESLTEIDDKRDDQSELTP